MKSILKLTSCLLITFFVSCSSDGGSPGIDSITLTTLTPQLTDGVNIISGGHASSNITNYETGICFSTSPGATIFTGSQSAAMTSDTDFSASFTATELGVTYYIKAYIKNSATSEVKYGNEVSINVPLTLSTSIARGISCNGFNVDITVGNSVGTNIERGICYGTGQNPKVEDTGMGVKVKQSNSNGAGTFNVVVEDYFDTTPSTNYYLRSFVKMGSTYYYGNQITFKTTGYIGGSGGFIFYDKGETTNGWRYLEAYSSALDNGTFYRWACNTNFIAGISNEIGTGRENTQTIKGICNFNNIGAAVCGDKTYNGQAAGDWFIPSINELKQLYKLKIVNSINFGNISAITSSSQSSNTDAFGITWSGSNAGVQVLQGKTSTYIHWPARRF